MSSPGSLLEEFRRAIDDGGSEFDVAVLVAQVIDEASRPSALHASFDALIEPLSAHGDMNAERLLSAFRELGFGAHRLSQVSFVHSDLAWVMENRQGIPISLAVLLIEGARRCGLTSTGINFPGHFLVSLEDMLVDPLTMQIVDPAELTSDKLHAGELQELMQQATPRMFGLRMLNNLKAMHLSGQNFSAALDVIDCQIAMCEGDAGLRAPLMFERGEVFEQLGAFSMARAAYARCVELTRSSEMRSEAQKRVDILQGRDETLH